MTITITDAAARQIKQTADDGGMTEMILRIAAKRTQDGGIEYAMGFDESGDSDQLVESAGVRVAIAPTSIDLVTGMTLDFVELEPGRPSFIFMNPNDPHYVPPKAPTAHNANE